MTVREILSNVLRDDIVKDVVVSEDHDALVGNLQLETGDNFLLETGFFLLLE